MRTLTKQNLLDYITGAVILGCGGGGGVEWGKSMIEDAFENGYSFRLENLSEVSEEAMLCIVAGVGGGVSQEVRDRLKSYYSQFSETKSSRVLRLQRSTRELSDYIGEEFYAYIASETGGR